MLSRRQEAILRLVIGEYIDTAQPVGSETIARKYTLGVSSATIRGEMAELEEAGMLTHPHTSAGRIPSARGYRHYIEYLMVEQPLSLDDQYRILHQFHQVESEVSEWTRLAAAVLASAVHNATVVSLPTVPASRVQRIDLIPAGDYRIWLIALFQEGLPRQHLIVLDEPVSSEDLAALERSLNLRLQDETAASIAHLLERAPAIERLVAQGLIKLMNSADQQRYQDVCLEGLRELLRQPEFSDASRLRRVLDLLSDPPSLLRLLPPVPIAEGVQINIGEETGLDALQDLSVVITGYGLPGHAGGALAILGPTRMDYARTIPSARYVAVLLSDLLRQLHD